MLVLCVNATFAGAHLGLCWAIAERHFPDLKTHVRNPYPTLGQKAHGRWLRFLLKTQIESSILINFYFSQHYYLRDDASGVNRHRNSFPVALGANHRKFVDPL